VAANTQVETSLSPLKEVGTLASKDTLHMMIDQKAKLEVKTLDMKLV
jgi:hypothetical protein